MVILHAFLALLAGYATMAVLVIVMTALLTRLAPSWTGAEGRPQPGYVFVNLGYSFLAAAAGGYATAWAAVANPLIHVLALGLVVLAGGAGEAEGAGDFVDISHLLNLCHYCIFVSPTEKGGRDGSFGTRGRHGTQGAYESSAS
jgi:hypothetical protein